MHPFLKVQFGENEDDVLKQLSNDTLEDIDFLQDHDSGIPSHQTDLHQLVQEVNEEMHPNHTTMSHSTISHTVPEKADIQAVSQTSMPPIHSPVQPVQRQFDLSDASFSSSVQQQDYLKLSRSTTRNPTRAPSEYAASIASAQSTTSSRIKTPSVSKGQETVQLDIHMKTLLSKYNIQ